MGADFNILEYADPELDVLSSGEKTNILDSLDLVDAEPDKDDKKDVKTGALQRPTPNNQTPVGVIKQEQPQNSNVTVPPLMNPLKPPPPLAASQAPPLHQQQPQVSAATQLTHQQQIHQQMLAQVN